MITPPRRSLGAGPTAPIRATEADLDPRLPGIGFPDLTALRARGVLGPQPAGTPTPNRRTLKTR
ncbi:hypothetical protein ACFY9F_36740 [Streptomyces sp. NPDC012421]|uniref:hypothetical protein n=1 Tax=Streptomyces sp. NPDC012421 TaxID=3364832 RepID=UPI0036F08DCA